MSSTYLLITIFVCAILQATSSEKCVKFDGAISEGSIVLNTSVICSCYKSEPSGPDASAVAVEKTCNVPFGKKVDGIVTITLEDLCGKCKSAPIVPEVLLEGRSSVSSSSLKPVENTTLVSSLTSDNVTESAPIIPEVDPERSAPPIVASSSVKPLENVTVASPVVADNTTESAPIIPEVEPERSAPPIVASSSVKPSENATAASPAATDNTTESASILPEGRSELPTGGSVSAPNATDDGLETSSPIPSHADSTSTPITRSTLKPLESATPVPPVVDKSINSTTVTEDPGDELPLEISSSVATKIEPTTATSSTSDKGSKSEHWNREDSGSGFSTGSVFLFFLCGAIVGVFLVLAVKYVRNRYKSRSYETNDAPQP